MEAVERIARTLPESLRNEVAHCANTLLEIRLRAGRPAQLVCAEGQCLCGEPFSSEQLRGIAGALMEYSIYAWEEELAQGFFTLEGGCRVGVSGRYALRDGRPAALTQLQSLCVRIAREKPGCMDALVRAVCTEGGLQSLLLVSRPGLGKTTCLRDLARQLSERGYNVALADERGELAALCDGIPALDVGVRTDVMDFCPKHIAIAHMVRALAPDVIVTDELGDARDAAAVNDARRSGVAVIASAHAGSIAEAFARASLREMAQTFDLAARLDGAPGQVVEIVRLGQGT